LKDNDNKRRSGNLFRYGDWKMKKIQALVFVFGLVTLSALLGLIIINVLTINANQRLSDAAYALNTHASIQPTIDLLFYAIIVSYLLTVVAVFGAIYAVLQTIVFVKRDKE
jgi:uncharacterized BrkB/YihY/UPF0761 family membrane protein